MLNSTVINLNCKPENLFAVRQEGVITDAIHSQAFLFGDDMSKFKRKDGRQLCECGCGSLTNPGRKFINSHNNRGKNFKAQPPNSEAPFCQCLNKCYKKVKWDKNN